MAHTPCKPRPLRLPLGRHKKCVALNTDTYIRLSAFAQQLPAHVERRHPRAAADPSRHWPAVPAAGPSGRSPLPCNQAMSLNCISLAVDKASSNREEEPDWFNLEIWSKQAQVAADYVRKGSLI